MVPAPTLDEVRGCAYRLAARRRDGVRGVVADLERLIGRQLPHAGVLDDDERRRALAWLEERLLEEDASGHA